MKQREEGKAENQNWVWVTRPAYYLEKDGSGFDRDCLDPEGVDPGGSWTCHKDTREGDMVVLYRTAPRKDIGYLLRAESDAFSLMDDEYAAKQGWKYGCNYAPLFKFDVG